MDLRNFNYYDAGTSSLLALNQAKKSSQLSAIKSSPSSVSRKQSLKIAQFTQYSQTRHNLHHLSEDSS